MSKETTIGYIECDKIKYCSEKSASKALKKQKKWNARVRRVYQCSICKGFHLTSSKYSWGRKNVVKRHY